MQNCEHCLQHLNSLNLPDNKKLSNKYINILQTGLSTTVQFFGYEHLVLLSVFSIRAGGRRDPPAISRQLTAYFENK